MLHFFTNWRQDPPSANLLSFVMTPALLQHLRGMRQVVWGRGPTLFFCMWLSSCPSTSCRKDFENSREFIAMAPLLKAWLHLILLFFFKDIRLSLESSPFLFHNWLLFSFCCLPFTCLDNTGPWLSYVLQSFLEHVLTLHSVPREGQCLSFFFFFLRKLSHIEVE